MNFWGWVCCVAAQPDFPGRRAGIQVLAGIDPSYLNSKILFEDPRPFAGWKYNQSIDPILLLFVY
jgi:hypothetical protein